MLLQLYSDELTQSFFVRVPAHSKNAYLSRVRLEKSLANLYGGGFPRSIWPQEREALAPGNRQVEAIDRYYLPKGLAERPDYQSLLHLARSRQFPEGSSERSHSAGISCQRYLPVELRS